jgi:hypothetical protein
VTAPASFAGGPAFVGWRTTLIALLCATLIGGIGGLIGLGGGEFRLPILVGLIGFAAHAAVPMNQILSLVTLTTALVVRWHTGSLVGIGAFAPAVIALGIGGVTAAWFAAQLLSRVTDHRLERAIAVLLMAIGVVLIGERFLPAGLPALVPAVLGWQIVAGVALGLCIGTASDFPRRRRRRAAHSDTDLCFRCRHSHGRKCRAVHLDPDRVHGAVPLQPHGTAARPFHAVAHWPADGD